MSCNLYIDCDNSELSWETLFRLLVGVTDEDCAALRVLKNAAGDIPDTNILLQEDAFAILQEDGSNLLLE